MSRLMIAINVFLRVLRDPPFAERAKRMLDEVTPPPSSTTPLPPTAMRQTAAASAPAAPARSDALALLSVLQREARLIDFLKEDIAPYADAQVGAAVRDVHRDAGAALERLFALKPVLDQPEGADVTIPGAVDSARLRLVGNLGGTPPGRGRLQHAGWQATKVELPQFTGGADTAKIVAPAEIEV